MVFHILLISFLAFEITKFLKIKKTKCIIAVLLIIETGQ